MSSSKPTSLQINSQDAATGSNEIRSSFLAGMLPLYHPLSSRQLRLMSALGTGILVGTALIIIIPEGVETLYSASESSHSHGERSISLASRTAVVYPDIFPASLKHDTWRREAQLDEVTAVPADTGLYTGEQPYDDFYVEEATAAQELENAQREEDEEEKDEEGDNTDDSQEDQEGDTDDEDVDDYEGSSSSRDPHSYVGVCLIAGFVLMYLIDTVPKQCFTRSRPKRFHISLNNLSFHNHNNRTDSVSSIEEDIPEPPTPSKDSHHSSGSSTTTGLVIHACADGIALGASSTTTSRLTFIIFVALIFHKAPAAFSLTSVLLKQGLAKRTARAHLIVFALAAPVGALLTWFSAHVLGYTSSGLGGDMSTEFATGILLLFSGGTFLYVAVHAMQDSAAHDGAHGGEAAQMNGYRGVAMSDLYESGVASASAAAQGAKGDGGGGEGRVGDTLVTVAGMVVPLFFNFGHGH